MGGGGGGGNHKAESESSHIFPNSFFQFPYCCLHLGCGGVLTLQSLDVSCQGRVAGLQYLDLSCHLGCVGLLTLQSLDVSCQGRVAGLQHLDLSCHLGLLALRSLHFTAHQRYSPFHAVCQYSCAPSQGLVTGDAESCRGRVVDVARVVAADERVGNCQKKTAVLLKCTGHCLVHRCLESKSNVCAKFPFLPMEFHTPHTHRQPFFSPVFFNLFFVVGCSFSGLVFSEPY